MPPVIANPVVYAPVRGPSRHVRFGEDGITDQIDEGRRPSAVFIPIARPRTKGQKPLFDTEWPATDRESPTDFGNRDRGRVRLWRSSNRTAVASTARRNLEPWSGPDREDGLLEGDVEALSACSRRRRARPCR